MMPDAMRSIAASTGAIRDKRRTTVILMVNTATGRRDQIRVCEPGCRNYFLSDLGIPGAGQWKYKPHGEADVTAAWSGKGYHVTWKRCRPSDLYCDQCGAEWMTYIPALIADAQARSARLKGTMTAGFVPFTARTDEIAA